MRLLYLIDSLVRGGKERRMVELVKGLVSGNTQDELTLVVFTDRVDYKEIFSLPIKVHVLKRSFRKDLRVMYALEKIVQETKPDLIHSWSSMTSVMSVFSVLFHGIPFLNSCISDAPPGLTLRNSIYFRVHFSKFYSRYIISNSQTGLKAYKIKSPKGVCIYNGVDINRFNKENIRSYDFGEQVAGGIDGRFIITMTANFNHWKDHITVVDAAQKVIRKAPEVLFIFMGEGYALDEVKERIAGYASEKNFLILGRVDNVEGVLARSDVGLLITNARDHGEGISNAVLEYMFMKLPVISTRGGAVEEIIQNGKEGYLVEDRDADALAEKLLLLHADADLREKMGNYGFDTVVSKFDLSTKTNEYRALYENCLQVKNKNL
jgi:glycosyltransferase involved in cell wall biosynthesis